MENGLLDSVDRVEISPEQFDLEAYISSYSGRSRIARLRFIAEKIASKDVQKDAISLALEEAKKGKDTGLYKDVASKAQEIFLDERKIEIDEQWISNQDNLANIRREKLEQDLTGYKHLTSMCLSVVQVSAELAQWSNVVNYVAKSEQTPEGTGVEGLGEMQAKIKAYGGLAHLAQSKYKLAAKKFVETNFEHSQGSGFSEIMSSVDIATYGVLCALASFDRADLRIKVIENLNFKNYLELVPEVRELVNDFYSSRYSSCLALMEKIRPHLLLDLHLHSHVDSLYKSVRSKALIQYTTPFISVDLRRMAVAFGDEVSKIEKELAGLIMEDQIQARIDSHNKILYAQHANQRNSTFQKAITVGENYTKETKALLLRSSLLRNEVVVKGDTKGKPAATLPF